MRNRSIDWLKLLLAFMILALHVFSTLKALDHQSLLSYEIANSFVRVAVPLFFMISGYFLLNYLSDKDRMRGYLRKLLSLFLIRQLLYLPFIWGSFMQGNPDYWGFFRALFYGYVHLWYLIASFGGALLLYLTRNRANKTKWISIFVLLCVGYGYQLLYSLGGAGSRGTYLYEAIGTTRNFLFFAFPYMLLGSLYASWSSYFSARWLIAVCLLLLCGESALYRVLGGGLMDHYLFVFPLSMALFASVLSCKKNLSAINPRLSTAIYLVHMFMLFVFVDIAWLPVWGVYLLVSITSLGSAWILDRIHQKCPYFLA